MPMVVAVSLAASIVIHSVVVTCCVCCFSKWFLHSSVILNMLYGMTATDADADADADACCSSCIPVPPRSAPLPSDLLS